AIGDALYLHLEWHRRPPSRREPPAELDAHELARLAARGELGIPEKGEHRTKACAVLEHRAQEPGAVADAAREGVIRGLEQRGRLLSVAQAAECLFRRRQAHRKALAPCIHLL